MNKGIGNEGYLAYRIRIAVNLKHIIVFYGGFETYLLLESTVKNE